MRLTEDHKVMTDRGWVPASQLRDGDLIRIADTAGAFGTDGDPHTGALLGFLLAAGTSPHPSPDDLQSVISTGGPSPHTRNASGSTAVLEPHPTVIDHNLAQLAKDNGVDPDQPPQIPPTVFQGSKAMQSAFLQALFSTDGDVVHQGNKGITVRLPSAHLPSSNRSRPSS